ncbi:hypothetical protein TNCT1_35990 [Streptomyces sp. 1-11]|nr:hypothetical protein TNCT1_35990 [Streptomyces sp. 1-11]
MLTALENTDNLITAPAPLPRCQPTPHPAHCPTTHRSRYDPPNLIRAVNVATLAALPRKRK